jgi:nitrilase
MAESVYKAACVQAVPCYFDIEAGVEKTIKLITEAGANGAKLIAFPECWIPGYPWWAWLDAALVNMQFVQRHFNNCMTSDGPEMQRIAQAAVEAGVYVVLGYSERAGGSLYISQMHIDPFTGTMHPRRKLKPTFIERTLFGEGDGSDYFVRDTELGRIGGLCCWEHLQPLNKYAMYAQNEQVHCAAWPGFALYAGKAHALGAEVNTSVSQVYAAEGQCFVLAATTVVDQHIQDMICDTEFKRDLVPLGGGASRIFGPDGSSLAEPLGEHEEGIIYADIDLDMISLAKAASDPAGHYSRPDVFQLQFDATARPAIVQTNNGDARVPIAIEPVIDESPLIELVR